MPSKTSQQVIELLVVLETLYARISQYAVEALYTNPTIDPTTVSGAGVSQDVVEVLCGLSANAMIGQDVVEVLCTASDLTPVSALLMVGYGYVT